MSVALLAMPGSWEPPRLGLHRVLLIALGLEITPVVLLLWLWHHDPAPPLPAVMPQQVTTVSFVRLPPQVPVVPKVVPPPPLKSVMHKLIVPKIVPPPPLPKPDIVIPKKIRPKPVAHKPVVHKPVVHKPEHKLHPVPHPPVVSHLAPQAVKSPTPTPRVVAVPGPPPSAIAAYAASLHALIQNNVVVSAIILQLGLSGSVRVRFTLGPRGGHVLNVRVLSTDANRLIRQVALKTVQKLSYPPFPTTFGPVARTFEVTVQIEQQ